MRLVGERALRTAARGRVARMSHRVVGLSHSDCGVIGRKRTALDREIPLEVANALLVFTRCENLLNGRARISDYGGKREQRQRSAMTPLPDGSMDDLRQHAEIKRKLSQRTLTVLKLLTLQCYGADDAPSDAQCGLALYLSGNAALEWRRCVLAAGIELLCRVIGADRSARERITSRLLEPIRK